MLLLWSVIAGYLLSPLAVLAWSSLVPLYDPPWPPLRLALCFRVNRIVMIIFTREIINVLHYSFGKESTDIISWIKSLRIKNKHTVKTCCPSTALFSLRSVCSVKSVSEAWRMLGEMLFLSTGCVCLTFDILRPSLCQNWIHSIRWTSRKWYNIFVEHGALPFVACLEREVCRVTVVFPCDVLGKVDDTCMQQLEVTI